MSDIDSAMNIQKSRKAPGPDDMVFIIYDINMDAFMFGDRKLKLYLRLLAYCLICFMVWLWPW